MWYLLMCLVALTGSTSAYGEANVCKNLLDYYTDRDRNPNCYHNPDMYLPVPEIIQRHGYPFENYTVTTRDGYVLRVFRIPHASGPPVFIQHRIAVSSMVFVNIGRKSLAFVLADSGYDVWLGNFRGTTYSDRHVTLHRNDKAYWNYTFHELGIYDLPTQLDFVANKTRQKMFYIGYSMGTTAYYVYNTEYPNLARKRIRIVISLAPIAFVHHIETPLRMFIPQWNLIEAFLQHITNGSINQRIPEFIAERAKRCLPNPTKISMCQILGNLLFGFDASQQDMETLPVTVMQDVDAIAIKTVTHYIQLVQTGRFQQFDYGKHNKEAYGTAFPPQYDLSKVNVPNHFVRAESDPLATRKNVEETYSALPKEAKPFDVFLVDYDNFNHADFVVAKDVKQLLYDPIVKFLKTNENVYT